MSVFALGDVSPMLPAQGEYFIAPNATVIGNVKLEPLASIWFGAVIRGDNELIHIGERSNIQDNCVLHTDPGYPMTIGPDVTVGHLAMLHGCTIEGNCLIGINSVVLNGARIGRNCIIGANAFIAEGKEIPPNSMVLGSPGKVVRQVTDEQARLLTDIAGRYVA
ncbi:MAG: gamma carbonic anhydrase family protein, partial [Hyphomicrobiales bacterium]